METPRIKKIRSNNLTPFRSPRGIASGKRALSSYRKQKANLGVSQCSVHSPYPPSLAALLSSRIDRYKRICPNLSDDFEQKVGLSPIALAFNSPQMNNEDKAESQSSFLESVLHEQNEGESNYDGGDLYSENQRIIKLIIELSAKCTQNIEMKDEELDMDSITEYSRRTEVLSRKLSRNLQQMQSCSSSTTTTSADHHERVVGELKTENEILKGKLTIYQKQIETMNERETVPVDANEAVRYLKTKLDRSLRQVEEGKELVNMLRTALSDSIQERLALEDTMRLNSVSSPRKLEESFKNDEMEQNNKKDIEEEVEVEEVEVEEKLDQGEYDEVLAHEYQELLFFHKAEAQKEQGDKTLAEVRKALEAGEDPTASLAECDVDYSKMISLVEEAFLSPATNVSSHHRIEEFIGHALENQTLPTVADDGTQKQQKNGIPTHRAVQVEQPPSTLSWLLESTGLASKPELHSAVLIF